MKTLKFLCLAFLLLVVSACSNSLNDYCGGVLNFDFSGVINHYSNSSRSIVHDDGDLSDLTEEERALYDIITNNLKYAASVSVVQQNGSYTKTITKEAPYSDDPDPDFLRFYVPEIPVGIQAVVRVTIGFGGTEATYAAMRQYIIEHEGIDNPDESYVNYILRTIIGTSFDYQIYGSSAPFIIQEGDNHVVVRLRDNAEEIAEGSTGVQVGLEVNQPLVLAWKDESDNTGFRFLIKIATEGYENPRWYVNDNEVTDTFTASFGSELTFQKEGIKLIITGNELFTRSDLEQWFQDSNDGLSIKCIATRNGVSDTVIFDSL